jgi:signal-transduction protein with cAMP-binding, CBS, and nucleotidyltransferase domain
VRDVYTPDIATIDEEATLPDAAVAFLAQQAQSLLVRRGQQTVGILRLSDLFDELARQIRQDDCAGDTE